LTAAAEEGEGEGEVAEDAVDVIALPEEAGEAAGVVV
jgi:hypothetical protein